MWGLSARFWSWIKDPLRAVAAVLLLTPGSVDAEGNFLAPAIFIVAFELLTVEDGGIGPLLGVRLLLFVIGAVLAAWVLRALWYWLVASRRTSAVPRRRPIPRLAQRAARVDIRDRSGGRDRS